MNPVRFVNAANKLCEMRLVKANSGPLPQRARDYVVNPRLDLRSMWARLLADWKLQTYDLNTAGSGWAAGGYPEDVICLIVLPDGLENELGKEEL